MSGFAAATGMQKLQEAIDNGKRRAEAAGSMGQGSSLNYFKWDAGERKILRFIADDMITADFYDFIVCKTGKTQNFMVNPDYPNRLKQYMSATPGIGWRKPWQSNTLEEPKATERAVCVAVLRKEVPDPENPGRTKVEDYLFDREIDGKTYPSRYFGIVQQGVGNFWHTLVVSCFKRFGSIATMDYEITREGAGIDTKYSIIPLPEDPVLNNQQIVKDFYFYGQKWDNKDEQRFLKCPMTTPEWAEYFSGEDRHKHWLVPDSTTASAPAGGLGEFHPDTTSNDEAQASAAPTSTTNFSSLAETLLNQARKS